MDKLNQLKQALYKYQQSWLDVARLGIELNIKKKEYMTEVQFHTLPDGRTVRLTVEYKAYRKMVTAYQYLNTYFDPMALNQVPGYTVLNQLVSIEKSIETKEQLKEFRTQVEYLLTVEGTVEAKDIKRLREQFKEPTVKKDPMEIAEQAILNLSDDNRLKDLGKLKLLLAAITEEESTAKLKVINE